MHLTVGLLRDGIAAREFTTELRTNHHAGTICVAADQIRHNRRIGYPKIVGAENPEARINNRFGYSAHPAGPNRVRRKSCVSADIFSQATVRVYGAAWPHLFSDPVRYRGALHNRADDSHSRNQGVHIRLTFEEPRLYQWGIAGACTRQADAARALRVGLVKENRHGRKGCELESASGPPDIAGCAKMQLDVRYRLRRGRSQEGDTF